MYCQQCGMSIPADASFCENCGTKVKKAQTDNALNSQTVTEVAPIVATSYPLQSVTDNRSGNAIIKCGNCGYIGPGEPGRTTWVKVLAWICVVFAPLITIIYFLATHKYRCPRCHSTFVGVKNEQGVFVEGQSGTARVITIVVAILVGIAIIGILSAVVLASLNTARQKASQATQQSHVGDWITFSSATEKFSIDLPDSPTSSSKNDTSDAGMPFVTNGHRVQSGNVTYYVYNYVYSRGIDTSDPNALLKKMLVYMSNGTGTKVISSNFTSYYSYPALDFTLQTGNEFVKGRLLLINQVPFYLGYDYFSGDYVESDYQRFISSFRTN